MLKSQGCCMFFLSCLAGLHTVSAQVLKLGCLGESIKIKENINFNGSDIHVAIYLNGDMLGMWTINNSIPAIINGQSKRLVLDRKGNIVIIDLIESDGGIYTIKTDIYNSTPNTEKVELKVIVPPTRNCKPVITRLGDTLVAELKESKNDQCGRPQVSVYWLEHPGKSGSEQSIIVHPGNDIAIYHACIDGVSLKCSDLSNVMEFCSSYTIYPDSSTSSTQLILIIIILVIIVMKIGLKKIPKLKWLTARYDRSKSAKDRSMNELPPGTSDQNKPHSGINETDTGDNESDILLKKAGDLVPLTHRGGQIATSETARQTGANDPLMNEPTAGTSGQKSTLGAKDGSMNEPPAGISGQNSTLEPHQYDVEGNEPGSKGHNNSQQQTSQNHPAEPSQ